MLPSLLAIALACTGGTATDSADATPQDSDTPDSATGSDSGTSDTPPPTETGETSESGETGETDTQPVHTDPPNLLLVLMDDVGTDKIGSYAGDYAAAGYAPTHLPATPVIDSLAESGVRFSHAWANPQCSPTRAALNTGEHGFRTGVGAPIPPSPELDTASATLAGLIGSTYRTALFGKWHLGTSGSPTDPERTVDWLSEPAGHTAADPAIFEHTANPLLHGFERFAGGLESGICVGNGGGGCVGSYTDWVHVYADVHDAKKSDKGTQVETLAWQDTTLATEAVVNQTLGWVGEVAEAGPWFASVNFHAAHTPHEDHTVHGCTTSDFTGKDLGGDLAQYQSMTECLDTWFGSLLEGLDSLGELDGTLIVIAGDNGTPDFAAESPFTVAGRGKASSYESGIRVPFVVGDGGTWREHVQGVPAHAPAVVSEPGRVDARPVHTTDLFATLLELSGVEHSEGQDSVSFVEALTDPDTTPADRFVYAETFQEENGDIRGQAALRDVAGMKLVLRVLPNAEQAGSVCIGRQLYDVAADPLETTNLYDEPAYATALADLEAELAVLVAEGASWLDVSTPCP